MRVCTSASCGRHVPLHRDCYLYARDAAPFPPFWPWLKLVFCRIVWRLMGERRELDMRTLHGAVLGSD